MKATINLGDKAPYFINKFEEKYDSLKDTMFSTNFGHLLLPNGLKIKGKEVDICKNFVDELKLTLNKKQTKQLNSISDIAEFINREFNKSKNLKELQNQIIPYIFGNDIVIKKAKFRSALKQACKNPAIKKFVEKSQDLER